MTDQHPLQRRPTPRSPSRPLAPGGIFAIAIVFALGAALAVPVPAQAQAGTANLQGVVMDADGSSIAGALVEVRQAVAGDLHHYRSTSTDEGGSYSFSGMDPGAWTVVVRHDKYRANETAATLSPGQTKTFDIVLVAHSTYFYSGTVYNGEDNTPLSGATVTVTGYGTNKSVREAKSDADGKFRVALFTSENQIIITKSGYGPIHDWVYGASSDIEREFHLYPMPDQSATVVIKVVDAAGKPVQAWVDLYTDWSKQQYDERRYAEGGGSDSSTGSPGMPAEDVAYPECYGCGGTHNSNSSATDESGRITMQAYPGPVVLTANRVGYLTQNQYVTLAEDETTEVTLTLKALPERTVTITGTVKDAATGDPLGGASVSVSVADAADYQWAQTGEDGEFSVQVRPGYTTLEVSADHWGPIIMEAEAVDESGSSDGAEPSIAPAPPRASGESDKRYLPRVTTFTTKDGESKSVDVALKPKPPAQSLFIGYVLDTKTGEPVPGAHVSLQNHETGDWGDATTDEQGSFKFYLYGGYHTVRVWSEGYLPYAVNVELPDDGTTRMDLKISPGTYASEGWWDPDGGYYGGGGDDVAYAEEGSYAPGKATPASAPASGAPRPAMDEDSESAASSSDGRMGNIHGGAGGLPAYDPEKSDSTFGLSPEGGDAGESPGVGALLTVLAVGLVALMAGLRRRE